MSAHQYENYNANQYYNNTTASNQYSNAHYYANQPLRTANTGQINYNYNEDQSYTTAQKVNNMTYGNENATYKSANTIQPHTNSFVNYNQENAPYRNTANTVQTNLADYQQVYNNQTYEYPNNGYTNYGSYGQTNESREWSKTNDAPQNVQYMVSRIKVVFPNNFFLFVSQKRY